ncbi:MAG: SPOR domain-containing protein [Burkholderiales bacterium]|nr:SPOR domain-containing protein [Burkholderiales bacterium]
MSKSGSSGKSIVTGIVIGLLLGIVVALGIALFLNRSPSPFANRVQPPEAKKPVESKRADAIKPLESGKPPVQAGDRPRFDFYDILPGDKDPSRRPAEKAAPETASLPAKVPAIAKNEPANKAAQTTRPSGKDVYYLQAGAFRSAAEADNLKARLALMGLQASVLPADIPNVGVMHRVRVGPYHSAGEAAPAKSQLAKNGIQANVVKLAMEKTSPSIGN